MIMDGSRGDDGAAGRTLKDARRLKEYLLIFSKWLPFTIGLNRHRLTRVSHPRVGGVPTGSR